MANQFHKVIHELAEPGTGRDCSTCEKHLTHGSSEESQRIKQRVGLVFQTHEECKEKHAEIVKSHTVGRVFQSTERDMNKLSADVKKHTAHSSKVRPL